MPSPTEAQDPLIDESNMHQSRFFPESTDSDYPHRELLVQLTPVFAGGHGTQFKAAYTCFSLFTNISQRHDLFTPQRSKKFEGKLPTKTYIRTIAGLRVVWL
jgi:hypothetical protein